MKKGFCREEEVAIPDLLRVLCGCQDLSASVCVFCFFFFSC